MSYFSYDKTIDSENFCLAPWYSIYQHYDGLISVCCQRPVEIRNKSLNDAMQDETLKKIRRSFAKNIIPEECSGCPKQMRTDLTNSISSHLKNFEKLTLTDDYFEPIITDFIWSNKCNFACMGCSATTSSAIEYNFFDIYNNIFTQTKNIKNNYSKEERFQYFLDNKENIKWIHVSSAGEPWIQNQVHELLDFLLKNNFNEKTKLASHTNGSVINYNGKNIVDFFKEWGEENSIVIMSHDGAGKRGEYIRYGYKDKIWLKTFNSLKKNNINMYVHYCLSLFNCLYLDEDVEWYKQNCGDVDVHMRYWEHPFYFSVKYLQKIPEIYEQAKNIFLKNESFFHEPQSAKEFLFSDANFENLNFLNNSFTKTIFDFDRKRNTKFVEIFDRVEEYYFDGKYSSII